MNNNYDINNYKKIYFEHFRNSSLRVSVDLKYNKVGLGNRMTMHESEFLNKIYKIFF